MDSSGCGTSRHSSWRRRCPRTRAWAGASPSRTTDTCSHPRVPMGTSSCGKCLPANNCACGKLIRAKPSQSLSRPLTNSWLPVAMIWSSNSGISHRSSTEADDSAYGEGHTFLGTLDVTTDASGIASFTLTVPELVPLDHFITATATDPAGNTSEFSLAVAPTADK